MEAGVPRLVSRFRLTLWSALSAQSLLGSTLGSTAGFYSGCAAAEQKLQKQEGLLRPPRGPAPSAEVGTRPPCPSALQQAPDQVGPQARASHPLPLPQAWTHWKRVPYSPASPLAPGLLLLLFPDQKRYPRSHCNCLCPAASQWTKPQTGKGR